MNQTGIAKHGTGWRATVSAGRNRPLIRKHFPLDTTFAEIQAWRADTKAQLRITRKQRASRGTFEADAHRYLRAVVAMPTYPDRARIIRIWVGVFGTTQRDQIDGAAIRTVIESWAKTPRATDQPALTHSTINKRLRALSNLWTVLDGRRAPNPVRDVPELPEPDPLPRAMPYDLIERLIAAIKSDPVKIRLRVLAYTGLTYSQLARLTPEDVDLTAGSMLVARRSKGKGARARRIPLLARAVEAFRALDAAQLWGEFDWRGFARTFQRAVGRLRKGDPALPHLRPYDLRHSFATVAYKATGSLEVVGALLQHESRTTTLRYALAAVDDVLTGHTASLGQHFGITDPADRGRTWDKSAQAKATGRRTNQAKIAKSGRK